MNSYVSNYCFVQEDVSSSHLVGHIQSLNSWCSFKFENQLCKRYDWNCM